MMFTLGKRAILFLDVAMLMHLSPRCLVGCVLAGVVFFSLNSSALALSKVGLTVRNVNIPEPKASGKDRKEKKDEVKVNVDQRKLEASLRNLSAEPASGLSVQFHFIGKGAGDAASKILSSDTKTSDIAPGAVVVVESNPATATFTPAHTTKPKKDSKEKPERVKAAGDKFSGWAVQVFSGTDLVAESYSSPTFKALIPQK